jgi:hypothetical protein
MLIEWSLSSTRSGPGFIIVKDDLIKSTLRKAEVNKEYVEKAPILIVVCSNTSSIAYFSKWGISSWFVIALQDNKVSEILELPKAVRPKWYYLCNILFCRKTSFEGLNSMH